MVGANGAFDGRWRHKQNPQIVEVIKGDEICGPSGRVTKITVHGEGHFSIELKGCTYYAWRARDQLIWDDDDVWVLMQEPRAFDGHWVHLKQPDVTEVIMSDMIHWPDGVSTSIIAKSKERFSVELRGKMYHAQRVGNQLIWNDGDVWVLQEQNFCNSLGFGGILNCGDARHGCCTCNPP